MTDKCAENSRRIRKLEDAELQKVGELKLINEKLDRMLIADEKRDEIYVKKEIYEIEKKQQQIDINAIGKIARTAHERIDLIEKAQKNKMDKWFQIIVIGTIFVFILGKVLKWM